MSVLLYSPKLAEVLNVTFVNVDSVESKKKTEKKHMSVLFYFSKLTKHQTAVCVRTRIRLRFD